MRESVASNAAFLAKPRDRRLQLGLALARLVRVGNLSVQLPNGDIHHFEGAEPGPAASLIINDPRTIAKTIYSGSLGFSEAYLKGWWDSPGLTEMLLLGTANEASWDDAINGKTWMRIMSKIMHRLRPNTRKGAQRNIADHYDLGNDFYELWLDPSMTYSAALFDTGSNSLEAAQQRKMRRVCEQLQLAPGKTLLEIGCGWGGFSELAAREYGAEVVAITLSREQLAYAQKRIAQAGLNDKVTVKLQDYRDVQGSFDAVASIEMIEAVGEEYWPVYFSTLRDRLRPGGLACIQAITIAERYFEGYRTAADFIQRYVFPGGMLSSASRLIGPACNGARRTGSAWIMPRPCGIGRRRSRMPGPASPSYPRRRPAMTPGSRDYGNIIWRIAKPVSARNGRMSGIFCWRAKSRSDRCCGRNLQRDAGEDLAGNTVIRGIGE
jgi:cyclopropane-fatty-acyl-phospholipid synthase